MKTIYLNTLEKYKELPAIKLVDRDRGQIDRYEGRPSVKFPCALLKISLPKRKNLDSTTQMCTANITMRIAFERLNEANSITSATRLAQALEYYGIANDIESLFQGFAPGNMTPWECISTIDEERPDLDIVRFVFTSNFVKEI